MFDYIEGGAEDELTLRANTAGFDDLVLIPRVLRDVDHVDLTTTILGQGDQTFTVVPGSGSFTR